jgi:hypothetical protein
MKRIREVRKSLPDLGRRIRARFSKDKRGSIPSNLIEVGNNESKSNYIKESKRLGKKNTIQGSTLQSKLL